MKQITGDQILRFEDWERIRELLRPLFISEKDRRRLAVGSHLTLLFENAQTVWYQVEEMLRTEKISEPESVQHEIDTYNELILGGATVAATLLIEFADPTERDAALQRLVGLERHLSMRLGDRRIDAQFDQRQMSSERISSIQFVKFDLGVSAREFLDLAAQGRVVAAIDHPNLAAEAVIDPSLARALAADLASEE